MTPAGIEVATFRSVSQCLNHCATVVPPTYEVWQLNTPSVYYEQWVAILFNTSFVSNSGIQFVSWLQYFVCQKHYKKFPNISTRSLKSVIFGKGGIWFWDFAFDLDRKNSQGSQLNTETYTTVTQIAKEWISKSWVKFMPIYISDNQAIILYEPANTEHLNKQRL